MARPDLLRNPRHLLAYGFGAGLAPRAPGTAGTAVGVLLFLPLAMLGTAGYLAAVAVVVVAGPWICGSTARDLGERDPGGIVWDEIAGFMITMIGVPAEALWIAVGFAAFRFFDVLKPWPVGLADRRIHGGLGIMADDVLAGIYACATVHAGLWLAGTG